MKRNQRLSRPKKQTPKRSGQPLKEPEVKHYVTGLNLTALDTGPSSTNPAFYKITSLNNIAHGDGQTDRTGIKIQAKKLQLRIKCAVDPNSSSTFSDIVANAHQFRVTVVQDRFPNGTVPNWGECFQTYITNAGQLYDWKVAWHNKRFKFLVDEFIHVPPSFVVYDGSDYHALGNNTFYQVDVPLKSSTFYSDGTSNTSAIQENNYFMFISCDASTSAYPYMKFSYRSNFMFEDY